MPSHKADNNDKDSNWTDWDGSPLTKLKWYDELPDRFRKYRSLWERGVMVHKGVTITASPAHSYHIVVNNIKEGTFKTPNVLNGFTKKVGTVADDAVPDAKKSRFADAPEQLADDDRDFFDDIAESITCHQTRKDYKESTSASGMALLAQLAKERDESNDDLASWASARRVELVGRGIEAPTVIAFNRFREDYLEFSAQMGDRGGSDLVTAKALFDAARDLGDTIQMKIDVKAEIKNPTTLPETVELIKIVLSKHETTGASKSRGRTLLASDTRGAASGDAEKSRFHDSSGKRIFVSGADDDCTVCNGRFGGGKHLRIHCPDYDRSKATDRTPAKKDKDKKSGEKPKRTGAARVAGAGAESADEEASYYDGNDGIDIASTTDVALSALFQGGARTVEVKRGAAKAMAAKAERVATPVPPQPDELSSSDDSSDAEDTPSAVPPPPSILSPSTISPRTPSFLPLPEARRRVDVLTPESPMADFRSATTDTGSGVSMRTGGTDHRDRRRILEEMRSEVGLAPLPVPTGLPLAPLHAPSAVDVAPPVAPQLAPAPDAPPAHGGAPVAPPPPPHETGFRLPGFPDLAFTLEASVSAVSMQRRADGAGGLQHAYSITHDGAVLHAVCPATGPIVKNVAPAGSLLVGCAGRDSLWACAGVLLLTRPVDIPDAGPRSAPASRFSFSLPLLAITGLLVVIAYLLAVIAGAGSAGHVDHAAIGASFHDPGTWLAAARSLGHHTSLRALLNHLLSGLVRGYTVAAACAHGAWHAAVLLAQCTRAAYSCLGCVALPCLAAVAAPIGSAAAAVTSAALVAAAVVATGFLIRRTCTAAAALCTSLWGGVPLRFILPKLLPRRLMAALGRVFPQIPPPGYSTTNHRCPTRWARLTGRSESRTCAPLISRANWQGRFHGLRQRCRNDLVNSPRTAPWLSLPLLLQLLLTSILDVGACALNLRSTTAGTAPHGPLIATQTTSALERAADASRRAATAVRATSARLLRTCRARFLLSISLVIQTCLAIHRDPSLLVRTADELAGWLIGRHACLAALHVTNAPTLLAKLVTYTSSILSNMVLRLTFYLFLRAVSTYLMGAATARWTSRTTRRLWQFGKLAFTILLLRSELALRQDRGRAQSPVSVAPLPSGVRGQLPPAVCAAVASLQRQAVPASQTPSMSCVPPSDRPRREAAPSRGPHAACSMPEERPLVRRVGFALRQSARALPPKTRLPAADGAWRSAHKVHRWAQLVIDSGCTWHVHNNLEELINVRDCNDVVVDANGNEVECSKVGDLLVVVQDSRKREFKVWLRGVRYSPSFEDTLISVDQLWHAARIDSVFRDVRALVCLRNVDTSSGDLLHLPFQRAGGLYRWNVGVISKRDAEQLTPPSGKALGLKSGIHSAGSRSHVHALPADDAAAVLHRRLHVSLDHLRRLGERSADAPEHVAAARALTCPICAEANSTRLPHGHSQYHPTHAGRLVHADIVGPFVSSFFGGYKYALVLVDDHTRFKFVYFLKAKSEAPDKIRAFISSMNAHASSNSAAPVRVVGSLHTDNAGEFLSRKFTDLLDHELVAQTTCPPHVHALNGVAERAINSILALTRSYLTAGHVPPSYWTHAVEMAVDVLNRTSGPSADSAAGPSSYELLTGEKPRVMGNMPFGCRAFAVKPRDQYSKTTIDPRAWVGVNIGRSARSPGAYKIYVPSARRIVVTSEAYFMESFYPLRPRGEQHDDIGDQPTVPDTASDAQQPPGPPARMAGAARSMASAFHEAVRDGR